MEFLNACNIVAVLLYGKTLREDVKWCKIFPQECTLMYVGLNNTGGK